MKHTAFLSHSFSVCFDFITMVRVTWNKEEAAACICEGLPSKQKPGGEIGGWIEQLRQIDFSLEIRWIFLTRTPTFLRDWEADESQVKVCGKCVKKGEIEQKQNKTKRFSNCQWYCRAKKGAQSSIHCLSIPRSCVFSPGKRFSRPRSQWQAHIRLFPRCTHQSSCLAVSSKESERNADYFHTKLCRAFLSILERCIAPINFSYHMQWHPKIFLK